MLSYIEDVLSQNLNREIALWAYNQAFLNNRLYFFDSQSGKRGLSFLLAMKVKTGS